MVVHTHNSSTLKAKAEDSYKFKANLIYIMNSRSARATWLKKKKSVSNKQINKIKDNSGMRRWTWRDRLVIAMQA